MNLRAFIAFGAERERSIIMTNEEFDRKMAFIVEQQAQFAFDIQRLQESQARTDQVVAQTGEIVARLANVTHVGFTEVNAKIMRWWIPKSTQTKIFEI